MISTAFEYSRATSVDDALAKLRAANGEGKLIAGGPQSDSRHEAPPQPAGRAHRHRAHSGASGIRKKDGRIEIGAGTVHHDVATSSVLRQECPMIAETAAAIGDAQVRNRGTLGGSIAHADPSADYPAALLALDAEIHVKGPPDRGPSDATRFLSWTVHGRSRGRRNHRERAVRSRQDRGLRQAVPARLALCDCRSGGGDRRSQGRHSGCAHRT